MALVGHISGSSRHSSRIGVSGSVIIANSPHASFPSMPGSDVQFYVHQQSAFGAGLASSGSISVKGSDGSVKFLADTNGAMSVASLSTSGDVGVGARLHVADLAAVSGSLDVAGNASFSQAANVGGNLHVGGGYSAGVGDGGVSAYAAGNLSMNGDLLVEGDNNAINMLSITGSSGLSVTSDASVGGNLVVTGDLTVNGTTATVNTTNLEVKDSLIGLGFGSGSVAQAAGDRGLVGGISGADNVAIAWKNSASEFQVMRTDSAPTATSLNRTTWANLSAGNVSANGSVSATLGLSGSLTKLANGTSAFIAGSGISITSASNGAVTITSTATTSPGAPSTSVQFNDGGSFGGSATFSFDKTGGAGGLGRLSVNETLSTVVTSSNIKAGASTVSLFNDTATTINLGASATSILAGASNVSLGVGGVGATNSTITASTGSFGRVLASNASQFNGGLTTTTLAASSTSNLAGDITLSGNSQTITHSGTGGLTISSTAGSVTVDSVTFDAGAVSGVTTLQTTGNATLGGTLTVVSSVTGSSTATFQGLVIPAGGISVNGGSTSVQALSVAGLASLNGNVDLGDASTDSISFVGRVDTSILPLADSTYTLGSEELRWQHIYTGDLHLRNDRGDYTLIEEPDFLSIRFNKTGKRYKFLLEAVPELDEELGKFSKGPAPAGN